MPDRRQGLLPLGAEADLVLPPPVPEEEITYRRRRKGHGWGKLPKHLPRQEVLLDVPENERLCPGCGGPMQRIDDGRLPIDNNATERDLRALTIGRKNWLFIGSPAAGPRAAVLYTVVASAARHDLDVWPYLCDVLERLAAIRRECDDRSPLVSELLTPLLPDVWAKAHPKANRSYRQHERESRAATKRARREKRRALARAARQRYA